MRVRVILLPALALAVLWGTLATVRSRARRPPVDAREGDVVPPPPDALPSNAPDRRPERAHVQPALDHAFGRALAPDPDARPSFVVGDFSGDGVFDLAVAVRPRAGSLGTLNDDLPTFRLQDATGSEPSSGPPPPLRAGEPLLAVVHGLAGVAWDLQVDRPAYLVRHAAGERMKTQPFAAVPTAVRMRVARAHEGEVIAVARGTGAGIVLWTGASYAWADVTAVGGSGPP
jgi:hypothetical protein